MVNITEKDMTNRMARAESLVKVGTDIIEKIRDYGGLGKGNVMAAARISGIFAAKHTSELIPMCHPLLLDAVEIDIKLDKDTVRIESRIYSEGKTGVEMEAMTAAAISALTVYDMVKSGCKGIQIGPVRLLEKTGGKSGHWSSEELDDAAS